MAFRILHYFIIFFLAMLLVGCSATGDRFQHLPPLNTKNGMLVVYRPIDSDLRSDLNLKIDNQNRGDLKKNGYRFFLLHPGKHWLEIEGPNTVDYYVTILLGQYSFIRLSDRDIGNILSGIIPGPYINVPIVSTQKYISVRQVKQAIALKELKQLRYSNQPEKKGNNEKH